MCETGNPLLKRSLIGYLTPLFETKYHGLPYPTVFALHQWHTKPALLFRPSSMEDTEKTPARSEYDLNEDLRTTAEVINAGGHKQELDRNFSLLSISAVGIVSGNTWAVLGGSIVGLFLSVKAYHGGLY